MKNLVFLVLLYVAIGCSDSNIDSKTSDVAFLKRLASATSANVSKENLPEWLADKIGEFEADSKTISIVKIRIFKGEWENRTVYFISNTLQSCGFCEVYYEDGAKIVWTVDAISIDDFCSTSKNWVLIYELGEGIY